MQDAVYRADLFVEVSDAIEVPQEVLEALENNGLVERSPTGTIQFSGTQLKWDPLYTDVELFMKFLSTLDPKMFSYVRFGDDEDDVMVAGKLRSKSHIKDMAKTALDKAI